VADNLALAENQIQTDIAPVYGHDGWLFSQQSVNALCVDALVDVDVAAAWKHELNQRSAKLAARTIRFFHIGVPDKLNIMREKLHSTHTLGRPPPDGSGFARWNREELRNLSCLIDPTDYLTRQKGKYPLYWKSDTRWAPWSSYMTYQQLCGKLKVVGNNQLLGYPHDETAEIMNLDLGQLPSDPQIIRRYRLRLRSKRRFANELALYREALPLDAVALSSPDFGEGTQVVFENRHVDASRLCIVLFGDANSAESRTLLTGMLAETFAEVHFVWGESIDYDYVDRVCPDVVITQCSECQMTKPPATSFDLHETAELSLERLKSWEGSHAGRKGLVLTNPQHNSADSGSKMSTSDVSLSEMCLTRTLLFSEQYSLDPPGMVQEHGDCENPETYMRTNEVTLSEVRQASVYFTGGAWWVHDENRRDVLRHEVPVEQLPFSRWRFHKRLAGTTLLFASSAGAHCYYHWMMEILPKLGLLEREGISLGSIDHFMVREITADWQLQTLAQFGIDASRIVETVKQPHWRCEKLLHIDLNCGINLRMHRFIPQWLKHLYARADSSEPRLKIYISRPEGVRRGIRNEAQLVPLLKKAGFTIIAMEGLSVAEQASLLSRADVLMSPHGGALTNMAFCRPGITVIELFSRHVFPYYYGLAANCGHHYYAIMEKPMEDYARLVNIDVAQSFASNQHETAGLSFDAPLDAVAQILLEL